MHLIALMMMTLAALISCISTVSAPAKLEVPIEIEYPDIDTSKIGVAWLCDSGALNLTKNNLCPTKSRYLIVYRPVMRDILTKTKMQQTYIDRLTGAIQATDSDK